LTSASTINALLEKKLPQGAFREYRTRPPAAGARQPAELNQPFGAVGDQPVADRNDQRGNAQPLVQTIHFVETAEIAFQKDRSGRKNHRQTHHANGDNAGVLAQDISPGKKPGQLEQIGLIGEPPGGTE
jgi:hypothetical protein